MKKFLIAAISLPLLLQLFSGCTNTKTEVEKKAKTNTNINTKAKVNMETNTVVEIKTSLGNITLQLDAEKAPVTVANFLKYVKADFYNDTIFHRVIPNFMIQGGGYTENYKKKKTNQPIINEADNGLKNTIGTIAMARTSDPNSATAQFFINTADNNFLNFTSKTERGWGYAVFGKVVKGIDVVEKIDNVKTGSAGPFSQDVPVTPVIIESISVVK
jgi:peptidyl-prolyl cis-trans isomerase B (cyclophilin B)